MFQLKRFTIRSTLTQINVSFFKDVIDESGSGEDGSGESGSDDGSTEEGSVEGESGDDNDGEIFKLTGFNFQSDE